MENPQPGVPGGAGARADRWELEHGVEGGAGVGWWIREHLRGQPPLRRATNGKKEQPERRSKEDHVCGLNPPKPERTSE